MVNPLSARDLGVSEALYPWTGKRLDVGGCAMHYLDVGPANPDKTLLMVHGNPTWSFYWRDFVREFSGKHRCVVPDHVGMGLSDKPGDGAYNYTLQRRVDDLTKPVPGGLVLPLPLAEQTDTRRKLQFITHVPCPCCCERWNDPP